jgi:hypothetical protein
VVLTETAYLLAKSLNGTRDSRRSDARLQLRTSATAGPSDGTSTHGIFLASLAMLYVLHIVGRIIEALLGLFCLISALMLYPSKDGKIQSKLEDFWIRVDEYQMVAVSGHAAFMAQVATLETRLLDRIFGKKLFSVQSLAVSCCLSFLSMCAVELYSLLPIIGDPDPYARYLRIDFLVLVGCAVAIGCSVAHTVSFCALNVQRGCRRLKSQG